jgi:hypothetical protein
MYGSKLIDFYVVNRIPHRREMFFSLEAEKKIHKTAGVEDTSESRRSSFRRAAGKSNILEVRIIS